MIEQRRRALLFKAVYPFVCISEYLLKRLFFMLQVSFLGTQKTYLPCRPVVEDKYIDQINEQNQTK